MINMQTFFTISPKVIYEKKDKIMSYLFNWKAVAIGLLFGIGIFKFKKHPILYIAIAALCGIVFQMYSVIII